VFPCAFGFWDSESVVSIQPVREMPGVVAPSTGSIAECPILADRASRPNSTLVTHSSLVDLRRGPGSQPGVQGWAVTERCQVRGQHG
jgi:hypothetical protein